MARRHLKLLFTSALALSVLVNIGLVLLRGGADNGSGLTNADRVKLEAVSMVMRAVGDARPPSDPAQSLVFASLFNCVLDSLRVTPGNSSGDELTRAGRWKMEESNLREEIRRRDDVISFLSRPVVNDFAFGYLINPNRTCHNSRTQLLFVVPSAPENFENRVKVRQGNTAKYVEVEGNQAKLLFFLGRPAAGGNGSRETQSRVNEESATHGDIVQLDFDDVYRNILLKAVSMLRWAVSFCRHVTYVIRTDDDVKIDVAKVRFALESKSRKYKDFILGDRKEGWEPIRIRENKYYLSEEEYPRSTLPPFAVGGLLGYPMSTVSLLYQAAMRLEPLWLDDIFITGVCAPKVNVPLVSDPNFIFWHRVW